MNDIVIYHDGCMGSQSVGLLIHEHKTLSVNDKMKLDGLMKVPVTHYETLMSHRLVHS
jgi:hypothetical protein